MSSVGNPESRVPTWLLRPLPVNAILDQSFLDEIDRLAGQLPGSLRQLSTILLRAETSLSYDAAVNRACSHIWNALSEILQAPSEDRAELGCFALRHFVPAARYRVLRRLAKDADASVRRNSKNAVQKGHVHEISLPVDPAGAVLGDGDWSAHGWFAGMQTNRLFRRREVPPALEATLPAIGDMADLRRLFDIRSRKRLGWLLVASDDGSGPYVSFNILKQSGLPRTICSPRWPLKRVQQCILRQILEQVPVHPAAHGFVKGRSTVTNALPHCGARIVMKFDLQDFFPTIHYFRVVGLFASLGYGIVCARFSTDDRSRDVAPALARLCTYTPEPGKFGLGHLPQGAPTSPAITNLICRGLDSRLSGLAQRLDGVYTRYADDLTFSFRRDDFELGRFRWWVDQICHQEGFFVNQAKFRIIRASRRQCVTGIVVNDSLRVPREERRRFRAMIHNCRRNGIDAETRGDLGFRGYLSGFASYLAMVHPEEGRPLLQEVKELLRGESQS